MWNKRMIAALIAAAAMPVSAHCAILNDVTVDTDSGTVTISGELPVKKHNQSVGIEVFKSGVTREDILTASENEFADMLIYIGQTLTDSNGRYSISFKNSGDTGEYLTRIGYSPKNKSREKSFGFFNPNDISTILNEINTASATEKLSDIIIANGKYIGVNESHYNSVSDKENVLKAVIEARQSGFANIGEFLDVLERCLIMQNVNEAADAKAVHSIITEYKTVFEKLAAYKTWQTLAGDEQIVAAEGLLGNGYTSEKAFYDDYQLKTISRAIYKVASYGYVADIIETNAEFLGLALNDYNNLGTKQTDVWKALANKLFTKVSDISTAFNNAVNAAKTPTVTGGGGGGGNSGNNSGNSSGGFSMIPPAKTDTVNNDNKEVFTDLGGVQWAKEGIMHLYKAGVVSGDGSGNFRPNDNVTRAEFTVMIAKCFSIYDDNATVNFDDVADDAWFKSGVAAAYSAGIVSGVDERNFAPYDNLTREQMAAIAYRAAQYAGINLAGSALEEFSDESEIAGYAAASIKAMQGAGIINGMGDGSFNPKGLTTRAAASIVLYKLITTGGI